MSTLAAHFRRAGSQFLKAPLINFLTVMTVAVAMLILGGYFLLQHNLGRWLDRSERRFAIEVYIKDGAGTSDPKDQEDLKRKITALPGVATAIFIPAAEARQTFVARHPQFAAMLGEGDNPFPAAWRLFLVPGLDPQSGEQQLSALVAQLQSWPQVENVDSGGEWRQRYIAFLAVIRTAGYMLSILVVLAAVFLIANTIRLNIFTRREEIEIYRLVGGTRPFIAMPFILEGMLQGALGVALALLSLYGGYALLSQGLRADLLPQLTHMELRFLSGPLVLQLFAVGLAAGLLGSFLSLVRFLRA